MYMYFTPPVLDEKQTKSQRFPSRSRYHSKFMNLYNKKFCAFYACEMLNEVNTNV